MILAIDFDGTLHMGQYPAIGIPMPYAIEVMAQLKADGHYIIINTCRSNDCLTEAINWLLSKGIPFDRVNDNHPDEIATHSNNSRKVHADVYVDDRQVGGLPAWPEIYEYIASLTPSQSCVGAQSEVMDITFPYNFDYVKELSKQAEQNDKDSIFHD